MDIFKSLETMFDLAMLRLLWALDTDPDLLSEEPSYKCKRGKSIHKLVSPGYLKKHSCPDWKGQFSKICTGVIGVIPSRQTGLSMEFPLSDTISWRLLGLVSICFNSFNWIQLASFHYSLSSLSASTFIEPGKYSAVIVIFRFKRYYQISLLIAVNSWFSVPPTHTHPHLPIFIKYNRAVMLSMRMWTDIAYSFNVKAL